MICTEEQIETKLAAYKDARKKAKRKIRIKLDDLVLIIGVSQSCIRNWIKVFNIPLNRELVNAKGHVLATKENIKALQIVWKLLYIEQYTIKGALRQLEKRGLLDGKHFLKV